ncbi:type II secretion system protein N [Halomonas elongata]|uniref:General secretion pathway protein GspN n=1 Tax=Halomonas elongata (strain ATCC 33173 / DSM 2581 / NBRC 15536 / NCIMB 2198 / 1H9) TaxID=768066 RepID=E1V3H6_HALED|nr:type II secretion system protein N [Halomonas elongata]WBF16382.1 hypothetical protein LM502_09745 [Halomonas elongata]WPU48822.1 type II secretion system protein N [Halomonas elongata DSM 2581]WVI70087.1 type II secretion system protein N [Halomonas elongata]CBV42655.1 general secretion pathway protein GspN [Halomonas elongata DSM 2581]
MRLRATMLAAVALNGLALAALIWRLTAPVAPHWLAAEPAPPPPATTAAEPPPPPSDVRLAATWQHPLFSPDRRPDRQARIPARDPLPDLTLTGVVLDGETRWAYLRGPGATRRRLAAGDALPGGWTLARLTARAATFRRGERTRTLTLAMPRLPAPDEGEAVRLPDTGQP